MGLPPVVTGWMRVLQNVAIDEIPVECAEGTDVVEGAHVFGWTCLKGLQLSICSGCRLFELCNVSGVSGRTVATKVTENFC